MQFDFPGLSFLTKITLRFDFSETLILREYHFMIENLIVFHLNFLEVDFRIILSGVTSSDRKD